MTKPESGRRAWLFAYALDSLRVSEEAGVLGAKKTAKKRLANISPGDLAVVYVSKNHLEEGKPAKSIRRFATLFEVTSKMFESEEGLWPRAGAFPLRVKAKAVQRLNVPLKVVRWDLSCLKHTMNYGLVFLNTPREIALSDVETLQKYAEN